MCECGFAEIFTYVCLSGYNLIVDNNKCSNVLTVTSK